MRKRVRKVLQAEIVDEYYNEEEYPSSIGRPEHERADRQGLEVERVAKSNESQALCDAPCGKKRLSSHLELYHAVDERSAAILLLTKNHEEGW